MIKKSPFYPGCKPADALSTQADGCSMNNCRAWKRLIAEKCFRVAARCDCEVPSECLRVRVRRPTFRQQSCRATEALIIKRRSSRRAYSGASTGGKRKCTAIRKQPKPYIQKRLAVPPHSLRGPNRLPDWLVVGSLIPPPHPPLKNKNHDEESFPNDELLLWWHSRAAKMLPGSIIRVGGVRRCYGWAWEGGGGVCGTKCGQLFAGWLVWYQACGPSRCQQ